MSLTDEFLKEFHKTKMERLICLEINPNQFLEFEPERDSFLKNLVFCCVAEKDPKDPIEKKETAELPAGNYLFAQTKELLSAEEIIDTAIELQKEGL